MTVSTFNLVEAILWTGIGCAILLRSRASPVRIRRLANLAFLLFLLFGLSDVVEMKTGAWWSPWWLLVWKAACVSGLAVVGFRYWRI